MNFAFSRNVLAVTVIYDENLGSDPVAGVNRAAVFLSMTAGFVRVLLLLAGLGLSF